MPQTEVTTDQMAKISEAFNRHDLDGIMEHFAEDARFLLPSGPSIFGRTVQGKTAIRQTLKELFAKCPDIKWVGHDWVSGERAVSEWRRTATLPDGTTQDWMGCDLWTFQDGKIACKDSYFKTVE